METKYTQGPWVDGDGQWLHDPNRLLTNSGDASLISQAPELLECLIWMVDNDETNTGDEPMSEYGGQTWDEINEYWITGLNRARAAIAKATKP